MTTGTSASSSPVTASNHTATHVTLPQVSGIILITAILVGSACILTRQWVYLVHVGAVLFALTNWKPKWLLVSVPVKASGLASSQAVDATSLRRWRNAALAFAAFAIVLLTDAYKSVIVEGTGSVWAAVATLMAAALVICGMSAHGQLESIRREPCAVSARAHPSALASRGGSGGPNHVLRTTI